MEHMLTQCPRLCLQTLWRWCGSGKEHAKKQSITNCFSHYVVRQPIRSCPWNILFIFHCTINSIWLFICFSICNIKDTILKGVILTSALAVCSSCCLMFYLLGLLEPVFSIVLVKCKHMTFPSLVWEPFQMEHLEPAVVKEEEQGHFWWPLIASIWQPYSCPSECAGNMIRQKYMKANPAVEPSTQECSV